MSTYDIAARLVGAWRGIPTDVDASARLHFLDAIAVGFAASVVGPVPAVRALAAQEQGGASVFTSAGQSSAAIAALVNGTLIHSLEFDDTHGTSIVHGSSVVAPAALAVAEQVQSSGADMLAAFTMGWELMIRLGMATQGSIQGRGFQTTSAVGPFGAACVAALLRGADVGLLANALGVAGSTPAGNFAFLADGDTTKAMQPGWAAHAGLMSVDLAAAGITGPAGVLEGSRGFFALYGGDASAAERFDALVPDIGTRWHLPDAAFKAVACCHYIHPFVEAAERLREEGIAADDIASVTCDVPIEVIDIIAEPWQARQHPVRAHEARWSLPYVIAAALMGHRAMPDLFVGGARPEISAFADRVHYEPWSGSGFPDRYPARITVRTRQGGERVVEIDDVLGGARRPLPEAAVVEKAQWCLGAGGMSRGDAELLIEELLSAADPDVARIGRALRS